jgi:hypothetical protein
MQINKMEFDKLDEFSFSSFEFVYFKEEDNEYFFAPEDKEQDTKDYLIIVTKKEIEECS